MNIVNSILGSFALGVADGAVEDPLSVPLLDEQPAATILIAITDATTAGTHLFFVLTILKRPPN
jgi:hypothetical protein